MFNSNYTLTNEIITAKSSGLTMRVPQGWFSAEENENKIIDAWLIKDNYSASISLVPLSFDEQIKNKYDIDDLTGVLNISQLFKKAETGSTYKETGETEFFKLNSIDIAAYQFLGKDTQKIRVAIFQYDNQYYEFTAMPANGKNISEQELFGVQNSVLSSIK
ncbi:MAG: hypothetical protein V1720_16095 [bacterium]